MKKNKQGTSKRNFKRVLLMGDNHSGHKLGLTPPPYLEAFRGEFYEKRYEMWEIYGHLLNKYKPFDVVIHAGDGIDGKGPRSGGVELLTTDIDTQADMNAKVILRAGCEIILMVRGTPYHTGMDYSSENMCMDKLRAEGIQNIELEDWGLWKINGAEFNVRHFIGGSSVPYGRYTALSRDAIWNIINSAQETQPSADVVVRAHVHYSRYILENGKHIMILPSLQGMTKFGQTKCSGSIDFGLVVIDVFDDDGGITCYTEALKGVAQITQSKVIL